MSLILHIVRKDSRALRFAWLFWLLLTVVEVILVAMEFQARVPRAEAYAHSVVLLDVVALLWGTGAYLLAAAVILQDSPVGTKAFWPTRPISGATLLGSKVLWILALVVLVPAILWVPWGIYCSYGAEGVALSLLRDCRVPMLLVGTAVVIATLTGDGPRFMLYNVLLAAFVAAAGAILAASGKGVIQGDVPILLLSVFGLTAVTVQFLTRRRIISVGLVAVGMSLSLLSVDIWPNAKIGESRPPVAGLPDSALVTAKIIPQPQVIKLQDGRRYALRIEVQLSGLASDLAFDRGIADVSLEWPDGSKQDFRGVRLNSDSWTSGRTSSVKTVLKLPDVPPAYGDAETIAKYRENWEAAQERTQKRDPNWKIRPYPDFRQSLPETIGYAVWVELEPDVARRILASPPKCTVSMDVFVVRPSVVLSLPLARPNEASANGARVHVLLSEESYVPAAQNTFLDTSIVYDSAPNCPLQAFEYDSRGGGPRDIWESGLVNGAGANSFPRPNLGFISLHFPVDRIWRADKWVEDPLWRPSARLAVVTFKNAGSFNKIVQSDRLVAKNSWAGDP